MELIERLKAFGEKSEIYFGCDEDDEIWQDCGKYVLDNLPAIIAALQFAEDVQKLLSEGEDPRFTRGFDSVWCEGETVSIGCPDIYTAARSAVAALMEGEA